MRDRELNFKGVELLLNRSMPSFYFHTTTAYDIIRHNGVELGKRDFLGANRPRSNELKGVRRPCIHLLEAQQATQTFRGNVNLTPVTGLE